MSAAVKGMKMENKIFCPKCGEPVLNTSIIDDAGKGEGSAAQSIICECGERITYWQITAQLRNQKTFGYRFQNWIRTLSSSRV